MQHRIDLGVSTIQHDKSNLNSHLAIKCMEFAVVEQACNRAHLA